MQVSLQMESSLGFMSVFKKTRLRESGLFQVPRRRFLVLPLASAHTILSLRKPCGARSCMRRGGQELHFLLSTAEGSDSRGGAPAAAEPDSRAS